ncbi:MAG: asparagine synthase (glutamine-hydrolyzing) [Phycisphaerales bacterium]
MCGILGIARNRGSAVALSDAQVVRMRDTMTHRGPDGDGLWRSPKGGHVILAHRRLAVIGPGEAGAQPMHTEHDDELGGPRFSIVYNGELYNDKELRTELEQRGVRFRSNCDTETVLRAFETWGLESISKLRGMFALAIYDARMRVLTLARDALGVKPLYYHLDEGRFVFASDVRAILAHPEITAAPDLQMLSAYMTTIRAALGGRTMYRGISTLGPGELMLVDLDGSSGSTPHAELRTWWTPAAEDPIDHDWPEDVRAALDDSVRAHLRADVPTCALLSGGLDSVITSTLARDRMDGLRTYCAGDGASAGDESSDLFHARTVAESLSTTHAEALLDERTFTETWRWMIGRTGLPLCTPNETAIYAVASRLRADGCIVTISGEGADELFAGYQQPLDSASAMLGASPTGEGAGLFELRSCAWTPTDFKPGILDQEIWHLAGRDRWLMQTYEKEFMGCVEEAGGYTLAAHQRFYRRINLTGLLRRLDNATMLASVEGRTPFADSRVAELAERIPMNAKFRAHAHVGGGGGAPAADEVRTKLVLRDAFADRISPDVLSRPKASFPLPFQSWMAASAPALRDSVFAKAVFQSQAIETVASDPEKHWNLAWPMINLAMWGDAMRF